MHFERVVTLHQHIAAPITDADHERVDLEIGWCLPRAEDFQDSLLCVFVLDGRTLLTLVPSDHVLHSINLLVRPGPGFGLGKVYAWGLRMSSDIPTNCRGDVPARGQPRSAKLEREPHASRNHPPADPGSR